MAVVNRKIYRALRAAGYGRRTALKAALPTRLKAIYSLARGGTVIYRAEITGSVTITRPYSFLADSVIDGGNPPAHAAITVEMDPVPGLELAP